MIIENVNTQLLRLEASNDQISESKIGCNAKLSMTEKNVLIF